MTPYCGWNKNTNGDEDAASDFDFLQFNDINKKNHSDENKNNE